MLMRPIAVVGLVAGILVAAGAGAYVAVRQNAAEPPVALVEMAAAAPTHALASTGSVHSDVTVEATEAVVDTRETTVSEETPAPAPVQETPREAPVTPPPPPPAATSPLSAPPAEPVSPQAPAPTPPVFEPAAEPTPIELPAVQAARADLPAIEGWSRAQATESSPARSAPRGAEPRAENGRSTDVFSGARVIESAETAPTLSDVASSHTLEPKPEVPSFLEFEIAADSVIGLQVDTAVSTRTAEVEDSVEARVTRDVLVADQVAIPAGTRMLGSVVLVQRGGKLRDAARLGVRFHTLVMDDGLRVPAVTETIYREGRSRGNDSVAKIGGAAVGGAILGAIFGGSRGAAIGGSIGAAGGTAAALNGEPEPAGLPPGTRLTVRLSRPVTITVEH